MHGSPQSTLRAQRKEQKDSPSASSAISAVNELKASSEIGTQRTNNQ
jgi:hypothetical protein